MIAPTARQTIQSVVDFTTNNDCSIQLAQEDLSILQGGVSSSDRDKATVILHLIQTKCFMFVRDYSLEEGTQTQTFPPAIKISQIAFEALERCAEDHTLPLLSRRRVVRCSPGQESTCKIICTVVTAVAFAAIYWTTGIHEWIKEL